MNKRQKYHFGPYILGLQSIGSLHLIVVNFVHVIFNLQLIWSLPLNANGKCLHGKRCVLMAHYMPT